MRGNQSSSRSLAELGLPREGAKSMSMLDLAVALRLGSRRLRAARTRSSHRPLQPGGCLRSLAELSFSWEHDRQKT